MSTQRAVRTWAIALTGPDPSVPCMASMSGTVVLCDQVYQAQGGKFVIAGTYTTIEVRCLDLRQVEHQVNGLSLYLRLRPEHVGQHACEVLVRDEHRPPWQEPVMRCQWQVQVSELNMRLLEMTLSTPGFTVRAQAGPEIEAQGVMTLPFSIEFRVDGEVVGTTPFDLRFVAERPRPPGLQTP